MEKPVAKHTVQIAHITIIWLFWCFQSFASSSHLKKGEVSINSLELSIVELILTPTTLTPGQQLNTVLEVSYADNVEIIFNAQQVDWQDFTLLSSTDGSPQWIDNHWQKQYHISLSVPVPGQYQFPILTIDSYLAEHHKPLSTSAHSIQVLSTAELTIKDNTLTLPKLQDIERVNLGNDNEKNIDKTAFIITMLMFCSGIFYWFKLLQRTKNVQEKQVTAKTLQTLFPTQLIKNVENNDYCDWQKLQKWLENQLSLQSNLSETTAVKQQYQKLINRLHQLRFSVDNQQHFHRFCHQCQQVHDNNKQNMLTNINYGDTALPTSYHSN